jgi:dCTP deaminase
MGYWTLEIMVVQPVRIYAGMPIGQLTFHMVSGHVKTLYNKKKSAKYHDQPNKPVESYMDKNKF